MNLTIKATGVDLTDSLRAYIDTKAAVLVKFLPKQASEIIADLEIGRTTNHHKNGDVFKAEINITLPGEKMIREVVLEEDVYTAIDVLQDKVADRLSTLKDKRQSFVKRGARTLKNLLRGFGK